MQASSVAPGSAGADSPWPGEDTLSLSQREELRERSDWMGLYLVAHAWGVIALAMAMFVAWPNPLTFLLAVMLIGSRQLGLAILMHDAAHRLLFRHATLNDWAGHWLCGAPVGASLRLYRPYHLTHHRHTQQAMDPDLSLSAPFPISRASLWRKVRRDLLGITGYQRRALQFRAAMGDAAGLLPRLSKLIRNEGSFFASNALLLVLLILAGHGWLYLTLWLLPLLTWYQLVSRIRNIAEHAVVPDNDDPLRNTRTTRTNLLTRLLLAPYWVNYHLEHHLHVFTPCWKLARAHRMLLAQGLGERMEIASGYRAVLRKATSATDDGPRKRQHARSSAAQI